MIKSLQQFAGMFFSLVLAMSCMGAYTSFAYAEEGDADQPVTGDTDTTPTTDDTADDTTSDTTPDDGENAGTDGADDTAPEDTDPATDEQNNAEDDESDDTAALSANDALENELNEILDDLATGVIDEDQASQAIADALANALFEEGTTVTEEQKEKLAKIVIDWAFSEDPETEESFNTFIKDLSDALVDVVNTNLDNALTDDQQKALSDLFQAFFKEELTDEEFDAALEALFADVEDEAVQAALKQSALDAAQGAKQEIADQTLPATGDVAGFVGLLTLFIALAGGVTTFAARQKM
ncbi:MAG: hypothetical protein IJV62_03515 [Eggerthellaceae bacterium]|nr:hypothetical protein [Eggerthellaceae bacterium]